MTHGIILGIYSALTVMPLTLWPYQISIGVQVEQLSSTKNKSQENID